MNDDEEKILRQQMLDMIDHHKWETDFQARRLARYIKAINFAIQFLWGDGNPDKATRLAIDTINKMVEGKNE